ncbi:hypothetical protein OEZ86_008643 [Tetradesmus obliquus]|nr:hypothetical protein OEZ86_008643 [Tetradesmus obliquus]
MVGVVDVHEFMSGLPAVLHQQGFRLTPITLEVGDYVLSREVVVERKALPDLFASLGSGRLYHQAEAMVKGYKTPMLLIEFDGDKAFCLTGPSEVADCLDSRSPQARLVLLLLHFPKLRLLWSRSQHATGELFLALKRNQEEPEPAAAALVGLPAGKAAAAGAGDPAAAAAAAAAAGGDGDAGGSTISSAMVSGSAAAASLVAHQAQVAERQESVVNQAALDLLRRLPGVTDSNWRSIVNGCSSLQQLTQLNVQQLEELMGSSRGARMLHDFLHAPCPVAQTIGPLGGG